MRKRAKANGWTETSGAPCGAAFAKVWFSRRFARTLLAGVTPSRGRRGGPARPTASRRPRGGLAQSVDVARRAAGPRSPGFTVRLRALFTKSHSRPHVSDDNPYSEAQFKTLKYQPDFPARFQQVLDQAFIALPERFTPSSDHTPLPVEIGINLPQLTPRVPGEAPAYDTETARTVRRAGRAQALLDPYRLCQRSICNSYFVTNPKAYQTALA
jgi:hypothetical protein